MKRVLFLLFTTILVSSCGVSESLRDDCGSDIKMLCNAVFGYKDKQDIDRLRESSSLHETKLRLLEQRLDLLETSLTIDIESISQGLDALEQQVTNEVNAIQSSIQLLDTAIQLLASQSQVNVIEQVIETIQNRLGVLESLSHSQVELVTVCENVAGNYPEVLLKVDETYMALFDGTTIQGQTLTKLSRFTNLVENTNYMTTDGRNVIFSVDDGEIVCQ